MDELKDLSDEAFLDFFFSEELTDSRMKELDRRLKNPNFKLIYDQRLNSKFQKPTIKLLADYIPMIIMIGLTIFGLYLAIKK